MGAIDDKYAQLGGAGGFLGNPVGDKFQTADGIGRGRHYQGGSIYWSPATGAHEVHGAIRDRWAQLGWEQGRLGYPISDEMDAGHESGRFSQFQGGFLYWDPVRGAYEVWPAPAPRVCTSHIEGRWEIPSFRSGVVGVHAALLHTNQILFFTYLEPPDAHAASAPQPHGDSAVLDLATGAILKPTPAPGNPNLFCAGQALMADGRLLVGGGERQQPHVDSVHIFTPGGPNGGEWQRVGTMPQGRWYPTCVTLPDERVLILGGADLRVDAGGVNHTYEIYDPDAGLTAPMPAPVLSAAAPYDTYPFVFVLPSGTLFMHAGIQTRFLDLGSFADDPVVLETTAHPNRNARTYNLQGTSVLLPLRPDTNPPYRARVMLIGGGGAPPVDMRTRATKSCEILDTAAANPAWTRAPPMAHRRVMPDAVLLPDGKVFVSNGSRTGFADHGANPVYDAELYDPETNVWVTVCTMQVPRLYHATALLLPDGRVLTAGTDSQWNPGPFHHSELRLELYSPPYLFRGPRPVIQQAPQELRYNTTATVQCSGPTVTAACLVRCGSSTHSFNSDQRYVGLTVASTSDGTVTLNMPPDGFVAPPGFYLLFVLNSAGVPSVARFVRLS